jgi:hypothetical protein
MDRTLFNDVAEFEARLGLPAKFYDALLREDDWSFVVKLNALFEGACTHVLTVRLQAPELADAFAHLDLAHSKYGKVKLLRTLGAVSRQQESILRRLAELRNDVVHNIANVGFTFSAYLAGLNASQRKPVIAAFGHSLPDPVSFGSKPVPKGAFVERNAKLALWLTSAEVLACLYLDCETAELRIRNRAFAEYQKLAIAQALANNPLVGLLAKR